MSAKLKDFGPNYIFVTKCRICGGNHLTEFLDLGNQPLANSFLKESELKKSEAVYPLRVLFCEDCNLVQLGEVVDPTVMFFDYVYFSSGMPVGKHWRDYAEGVVRDFIKSRDDLVVEIGSNDGHFLAVVKETHPRILGIDPAQNIARLANKQGIPTLAEFFSKKLAENVVREQGPAKLIIANNVVAHIDNHHDLLLGIEKLLLPDGVFVMEVPYLVDMFENLSFDTIYHEHLSYLALRPLVRLFEQFNMAIFKVESFPIQGNSLRVFASRQGQREIDPSVAEFLARERTMKLHELDSYFGLRKRIEKLKEEVVDLLIRLKKQGKRIVAYGAPAKGNTLLNYFGIGPDILDYATEELPSKIGLYTPGMHIPIVYVSDFRQNYPDYAFLLAWNYKKVAMEKEKNFISRGGRFIMPVGNQRIL